MQNLLFHNKGRVRGSTTIANPDVTKPFIVDFDASDFNIGSMRLQTVMPGVEQQVLYFSRTMSKTERKSAVIHKEMLALIESLRHFRCYILGIKCTLPTDYCASQWLKTFKETFAQVAR